MLIKKRVAQLRRLRANGAWYAEIVSIKDGPLVVQLLTESSTPVEHTYAAPRRARCTPKG